MSDPLKTDDSPDTTIPLNQGGSLDIPANPVNLDEDKMPPATTVDVYPPLKDGETLPE